MSVLSALYASVARARRRAWDLPGRRRRLERPVVSIGNLRVGGTGKTPTVACVARLLVSMGERPAVLSRGYARRRPLDGVVVVSDGAHVRATIDDAGDEPLMLARSLTGVPVLVSPDRYAAGRLAELHLGATVHLLDDGFQHLPLWRDADLVIVSPEDVRDGRTLPAGRLREPLDTARLADVLLVPDASPEEARALAARLGVSEAFALARQLGAARRTGGPDEEAPLDPGTRVYAVAGIARPERFFSDVSAGGLEVAGTRAYRDHYPFGPQDVREMIEAARGAGAGALVTTEKDVMRLLPFAPFDLPIVWMPLTVSVEPVDVFRAWLAGRLASAADRRMGA